MAERGKGGLFSAKGEERERGGAAGGCCWCLAGEDGRRRAEEGLELLAKEGGGGRGMCGRMDRGKRERREKEICDYDFFIIFVN